MRLPDKAAESKGRGSTVVAGNIVTRHWIGITSRYRSAIGDISNRVRNHQKSEHGNDAADPPSRFDITYLARLSILARRNTWREICGIETKEVDTWEQAASRRSEAKQK